MNKTLVMLALVIGIGLLAAIQPAGGWTVVSSGNYTNTANANVTTVGGNVTNMNFNSNISTNKWAGFWGNVSGKTVLSPGTAMFYTWTWTPTSGGDVCAVASPTGFNWAAIAITTATAINSVFGHGAATDNATNTLNDATCSVNVAGTSVTSTGNYTGGGTAFQTCAIQDGAATAKSDFAFCVNITGAGNLFNGQTGNYELLVPTNKTLGSTETYYFWLELR